MRKMRRIIILLISVITLGTSSKIYAQRYFGGGLLLQNFTHEQYNGEDQNLAIVQDDRGVMYFANKSTILEFDGQTWRHIIMPNNTVVYALNKDAKGRIYVGASKGELGYLQADERGLMQYKSLREKLPEDAQDFKMIRDIVMAENGKILFLSVSQIYEFDGNKFSIHKTSDKDKAKVENGFVSIFKCTRRTFIQEKGLGLLEYTRQGNYKLLKGTEALAQIWITGIFPANNDSLLLITWDGKSYTYKDNVLSENLKPNNLKNIYKTASYDANVIALGLFDGGLIIADKKLNVLQHVDTKTGLLKDNILSLYVDDAKNIWLGLSNGISVIHANTPISLYDNNYGLPNTTLSSMSHDKKLYIGNTTGLFSMDWDNRNPMQKESFKKVSGIGSFQVWYLDTIDGMLWGAGASGIFNIQNNKAHFIKKNKSIKSFVRLKNNPEIIVAVSRDGLAKISKQNNIWANYTPIKGFKKSLRQISQINDNEFWLADKNIGLFRVKLSDALDTVLQVKKYTKENGLPNDVGNQFFKYNQSLIFGTTNGIYKYDRKTDSFIADTFLNSIIGENTCVTDFVQDGIGDIWFKEKKSQKHQSVWQLGQIKISDKQNTLVKNPYLILQNNIHNIYPLPNNDILIGTEKGFAINDTKHKAIKTKRFSALIRSIKLIENDSIIFGGTFTDADSLTISKQQNIPTYPFKFRNIKFSFSATFFQNQKDIKYKYILEGNDKEWSDWKKEKTREYSNLEPGEYIFRLKAQNIYNQETAETSFKFTIKPPFYLTIWAYIVYIILFILFIKIVINLSTRRIEKQKENLERIVEERTKQIKAKNEELNKRNEEIKHKNKDITASINYAKRIQEAILPMQKKIISAFDDAFILFKPRDIVSGDFYWYANTDNKIIITAVDCTGHGVPGAFMSMIGCEVLSLIMSQGITEADKILLKMNEYIVTALKQDENSNKDGMDMALCVIDKKTKQVEFAGAKNPLVFISNDTINYIKGSRAGIGGNHKEVEYEKHIIEYQSPAYFYMFSDGFQDQFGGEKNKKFMIKRLRNLLHEIHTLPGSEQQKILDNTIEDWMKNTEQTDDILLMGFKI